MGSIHTKLIVLSSFLELLTLSDLPTTFTIPTAICFRKTPTPPLKQNLNGNYPHYPNYFRFFLERPETPPPPLNLNLNDNYFGELFKSL